MDLEGDHSTEVALLDMVIVDINGLHPVDFVNEVIPASGDLVGAPGIRVELRLHRKLTHHLGFSVGGNYRLHAPFAEDAPTFLIVEHPVRPDSRVHVTLVTRDDVFAEVLADGSPVLDARVVAVTCKPQLGGQLEILDWGALPDEELVVGKRIVIGRRSDDDSIDDGPVIGVAGPAGKIRSVEEDLDVGFATAGCSGLATSREEANRKNGEKKED